MSIAFRHSVLNAKNGSEPKASVSSLSNCASSEASICAFNCFEQLPPVFQWGRTWPSANALSTSCCRIKRSRSSLGSQVSCTVAKVRTGDATNPLCVGSRCREVAVPGLLCRAHGFQFALMCNSVRSSIRFRVAGHQKPYGSRQSESQSRGGQLRRRQLVCAAGWA